MRPYGAKEPEFNGFSNHFVSASHFRMGISNLKVGLGRKLSSWSGEKIALEREIDLIAKQYATLQQKQARVARLQVLIDSANEIMRELVPGWNPGNVKPSIPRGQKLPYPPGSVTRWAMQIIREVDGSFSSLELAEKIVEMNGGDLADQDLVNRVREAVDNSLRKKEGKYVRYVSKRPTRWARIED